MDKVRNQIWVLLCILILIGSRDTGDARATEALAFTLRGSVPAVSWSILSHRCSPAWKLGSSA